MILKLLTSLSKLLQWLILLTFLTPFVYTGCSKPEESAAVDTCAVAVEDTLITSSPSITEKTDSIDSSGDGFEKDEDDTPAESLSSKYPALKFILVPEDHTYTGAALVINLFSMYGFLSIFVTFLLLVLSGISKLLNPHAIATHLLLNAAALFSLLCYTTPEWESEQLWGFWLCTSAISGMLMLDASLLFVHKKQKNHSL